MSTAPISIALSPYCGERPVVSKSITMTEKLFIGLMKNGVCPLLFCWISHNEINCPRNSRPLFPLGSYFALTVLYCPNFVPLLLVGWQSPPCKLTIASEYFAGMKPFATFRATINLISIRNKILLITPCVHILSHRRRSVLEQETRRS